MVALSAWQENSPGRLGNISLKKNVGAIAGESCAVV
jgi:hypothetical protein